jgi:hypothetical protein
MSAVTLRDASRPLDNLATRPRETFSPEAVADRREGTCATSVRSSRNDNCSNLRGMRLLEVASTGRRSAAADTRWRTERALAPMTPGAGAIDDGVVTMCASPARAQARPTVLDRRIP